MYVPEHFAERRAQVLQDLMQSQPFATLVVLTAQGIVANHLPMLFTPPEPAARRESAGTLRGHVARANPVWRDADVQVEALAVFQGPHGYVSPTWYPSKQSNSGKVVPTWNYAIVQARGTLRFVDEPGWLLRHVTAQTDAREGRREERWRVSDAPAEFIDSLVRGIVGLELSIRTLTGKWKLSQNRNVADRAGVIDGLTADANVDSTRELLARRMRDYLPE